MDKEYNKDGFEVIDYGPISDSAMQFANQMLDCISDCFVEISDENDPENLRNFIAASLEQYEKDHRFKLVEMNKKVADGKSNPDD